MTDHWFLTGEERGNPDSTLPAPAMAKPMSTADGTRNVLSTEALPAAPA